MKVLFLSSRPFAACGVGDYTEQLRNALQVQGVETRLEAHSAWKIPVLGKVLEAARWADVVHVQYPTVDFKTSLVPLLVLALAGKPTVLTVHEYSQAHPLRRLFVEAMCRRARQVVFVEEQEQQRLARKIPGLLGKSAVIPIGSNMPRGPVLPRTPRSLVHFGLIRAERGLEGFLQVAGQLPDWQVQVIGQVQQGQEGYLEALRARPEARQVEWVLGLPPEQVAEKLSAAQFAYLPFPDGASPRRGSLLACLLNGVCCVTTRSAETPASFESSMRFAASAADAVGVLQGLDSHPEQLQALSLQAQQHAAQLDWNHIARTHIQLYQKWIP